MYLRLIVAGLFMLNALFASSQAISKRVYNIKKQEATSLSMDGILIDEVWQKGEWEDHFRQYSPVDGGEPSQKTQFKMFHDGSFIYVAVRCLDSEPDKIAHILSRRDDALGDRVGVELDSYNDHITAYCFYVNAAGVKWDYTSSDNNGQDANWNPVWWVRTSKDDYGWYAEMKIPLSELRFKPSESASWGVQIGRRIYRNQEVDLWQPMSREQQGWNANLGILGWTEKLESKLPLNATPYLVAQHDKFNKEPDNPFRKSGHVSKLNIGFDAKIGISNNWTTDITVNPDFGQVDADPSQVNLTAYEVFQQERRPFFIEGRNIFSFGIGVGDGDLGTETLFYTRRIGRKPHYSPDLKDDEYAKRPEFTRIIGAAKVSGRTSGGLSVGVMEALTAREFTRIDKKGNQRELEIEPLTNYTVLRVNQELNNANTQFGGVVTSTVRDLDASQLNFLHRNATTGGVNFLQYFYNKRWSFNFNTYFSNVQGSREAILKTQEGAGHYFQRSDAAHLKVDSSRTSLTGNGGKFLISKESGKLRMMFCVLWKSPQLEINDLGFARSMDDITQIYWAGYRFTKPSGIMRSANINVNQWVGWSYGGEYKGIGGNVNGGLTFKNLWTAYGGMNINLQQLSTDLLRGGPSVKLGSSGNFWINLGSDESRKFYSECSFAMGGSTSNSSERWMDFGATFTYRPASYMSISISPGYFNLDNDIQYIDKAAVQNKTFYILGRIRQEIFKVSARINVSITPDLTLQYWGQPFIATGNYSEFKRAANVASSSYRDRFYRFAPNEISYNIKDETYSVKEAGSVGYKFNKPHFTSREFLSNMVLRWEYIPGSSLFLVWSQTRSSSSKVGHSRIAGDLGDLLATYPYNVFLVKFSYRIGR